MLKSLRPALVSFVLLTLITGVLYPAAVTLTAQLAFAHQAGGSLIERDGRILGSEWIGQSFADPKYFWSRPSATGLAPYNAMSGSGSNQATTNPALVAAVEERIARLKAVDPENSAPVPVDLVTASASGLDPHISVAAARYQVSRIARLRNVKTAELETLIEKHTSPPTLGFMGQSRVNVLDLNLAMDAGFGSLQTPAAR